MTGLAQLLAQAQEAVQPGQLVWPLVATGIAAVLTIVGFLMRGAWRGYRALRGWVEQTARAVQTSNGHTAGELVESTAKAVGEMRNEITVLTDWAGENRDLAKGAAKISHEALVAAQRAETLAQRALERLDDHLLTHGGDKT